MKIFFETLDEELEKVNEFYGSRESEFVERGDSLKEQLAILVEFKRILEDRRRKSSPSAAATFSRSSSFSPRHSNFSGNPYISFPNLNIKFVETIWIKMEPKFWLLCSITSLYVLQYFSCQLLLLFDAFVYGWQVLHAD